MKNSSQGKRRLGFIRGARNLCSITLLEPALVTGMSKEAWHPSVDKAEAMLAEGAAVIVRNRISKLRERSGMSRHELASSLKTSDSFLGSLERQKAIPLRPSLEELPGPRRKHGAGVSLRSR